DLLIWSHLTGIFLDHILDSLYAHTFFLGREKKGIFMAWKRESSLACRIHIGLEGIFDFLAEIDDHFISAFPSYLDTIIFEIHILYIKSYTFGYTDTCPEKKGQDCKITVFCLFIIYFALTGKIVPAMIYIIEKLDHLIGIKTDDGFIVKF